MKAILSKRRITFETEEQLKSFIFLCSKISKNKESDTQKNFFKNLVYELLVDIIRDFEPKSGSILLFKVSKKENNWTVSSYEGCGYLLKATISFDFQIQKIIIKSTINTDMEKRYFYDEQSQQFKSQN